MDYKSYAVCDDDGTIGADGAVLAASDAYRGQKVRLMPDAHRGKAGGCVGFTSTYSRRICPNTVGVDIYCTVSAFEIPRDIDCAKLDSVIKQGVPSGSSVREKPVGSFDYSRFRCFDVLSDKAGYFDCSIGTLGSGNHYISVEVDEDTGYTYLCIHCGSRNLGVRVAEFYQQKAVEMRDRRLENARFLYDDMVRNSNPSAISSVISACTSTLKKLNVPDGLCYVSDSDYLDDYLHDVDLCGEWVLMSHRAIYRSIAGQMGWEDADPVIVSYHNYVDTLHKVIRKGAISAYGGEVGIVPLNMRDGSLLVVGKGNDDWNCSLPHGAGRKMSRAQARKNLDVADYRESMAGIYTSSVCGDTVDEAPFAYKDAVLVERAIEPSGTAIAHLVPIYNFTATR